MVEFQNTIEARKYIGRLIIQVLTDRIIVREAIRDLNYRDAQDSYLEQLAQTLEQGKELPKNIIKNYNQYYRDIQINQTDFMKKLVKRLCKFMNV